MSPRVKIAVASLVAAVVVAGTGIWWWYLRDDAPAPVSLESAVESVAGDAGAEIDGIDGTWRVDTETGAFDYESATGTFVGFRITEELSTIGSTEAVGRTGDVTGSVVIDGTTLTEASFEADVTTITTNQSMRDSKVQDALETGEFTTATFVLSEPVELGDAAASGETVAVTATGDLTIHGVTTSVEVPLEAQLVEGTVVVVGSLPITFSDYGVEVPNSPIVVSVEDHGTMEIQLLLTR